MGDIIDLKTRVNSKITVAPDKVLEEAKEALDVVFVAGYDKEGYEYFASSTGNIQEIYILLERFKFKFLNGDFE